MNRLMLCTDLDRTLIPNGSLPESAEARPRFSRLASAPEVSVVYVTGRHLALVQAAMKEWQLPQPDFIIADVGTSIWRPHGGDWRLDETWSRSLANDWQGMQSTSLALELQAVAKQTLTLNLQSPERQNQFKLSYTHGRADDPGQLREQLQTVLEILGVQARLVFSMDDVTGEGLLDILPRSASKLHALEALMKGEGGTREQTVFCGDSGNDLEVLVSGIPAVLVANATEAVRRAVRERSQSTPGPACLYQASGGLLGMNGNYAGGILEGVVHYHPWTLERLQQPAS